MGLFNFLKKSAKAETNTATTAANTNTAWDSLQQQPFSGDQATSSQSANAAPQSGEALQQRLARQGDKIIAAYYHGINALAQPSVAVSPEERQGFYDGLTRVDEQKITPQIQSQILQAIQLPSGPNNQPNYPKVFERINNRHGLTILNFAGQFQQKPDQLTPYYLESFLQVYPTPIEFAPRGAELIQTLKDNDIAPLKIDQYEDDLVTFQQNVYGKRYEYYQALEQLKEQAYQGAKSRADAEVAADRLRNMQNLQQTPVPPEHIQAELADNPYASPEERDFYQAGGENQQ